jgi:hypothetical protein
MQEAHAAQKVDGDVADESIESIGIKWTPSFPTSWLLPAAD